MAQTEAQRRWYVANREKILAAHREERETNSGGNAQRCRDQYARHHEKRLAAMGVYRAERRDLDAERVQSRESTRRRRAAGAVEWRDADPANHQRELELARRRARTPDGRRARAERQAARRARKVGQFVEPVDRKIVYERDEGVCGICGHPTDPDDWHLDHVIPLARGGEHSYANTQVAHPTCNLRKGVR